MSIRPGDANKYNAARDFQAKSAQRTNARQTSALKNLHSTVASFFGDKKGGADTFGQLPAVDHRAHAGRMHAAFKPERTRRTFRLSDAGFAIDSLVNKAPDRI